jgi:hypothetical protein
MKSSFVLTDLLTGHEPVGKVERTQNTILRYSILQICATRERLVERLLSLWRVYWNHEPWAFESGNAPQPWQAATKTLREIQTP